MIRIARKKREKRPRLEKPPDVSILPLPDREPAILIEDKNQFIITDQHENVKEERNMIKDQTNIPASLSNKINKVRINVKDTFHKSPPIRILLTKKAGLEGRHLGDIYKRNGLIIIITIIIAYIIIKGK